ncbi:pseudouridine synthase [Fusibacter ferrireducens]|uniref:Pseudouridine synthase n=1 Tax=Fusibacter ferrireducens TaxID=2785058 RepID=A0ABR9ZXV9_9FIRM|nr:pseudouridine synthase [Fusibacter ferrireducens]MBF4695306.1 pseudouridine synthase [Fusibacter ferrireducens]
MRINKYLSASGVCSRRKADEIIDQGAVTINGELATKGSQVTPEDDVCVNGKTITGKEKNIYIAFNKPIGIECTTNLAVKDNIISYINYPERIFPVGRLDKNSEGLILLTNDGELSNEILKARHYHEKEYIVTVDHRISEAFLEKMRNGVEILDTTTRPCEVELLRSNMFKIILTQGLNRQIRRMCEALEYKVVKLRRVRIINIEIGDLEKGKWRYLSADELKRLKMMVKK